MTGAEHYRAAERLLHGAETSAYPEAPDVAAAIAMAQVHATLAHSAALVDVATEGGYDMTAWRSAQRPVGEAEPPPVSHLFGPG